MKKISSTLFVLLFRVFGIIVLVIGIRLIGAGIYNYIDEHNQQDWISTTAYVVDIASEYSSSSRKREIKVKRTKMLCSYYSYFLIVSIYWILNVLL